MLALLERGLSSKRVGRELGISPRTADVHRANVMRKLEVPLARPAAPLASGRVGAHRLSAFIGIDPAARSAPPYRGPLPPTGQSRSNVTLTRSPGASSDSSMRPQCRSETALTSASPSPVPPVVRLRSSR